MKRRTILTATVIRAEEQSSKITIIILTFPSTLSLTRIQRLLMVDGGFVMRMMICCDVSIL